jgi:coenzyme Q-binding protein COQ10
VTSHNQTRITPYSAELMFGIVADVERYPQFLPWVTSLDVLSREHAGGREILSARMAVGFGAFHESYVSRVVLDPSAGTIDVVQTEGPFRRLENHWRFAPLETGCRVDFSVSFEFRSRLLNAVTAAAFSRVLLKMEDAFIERAKRMSKQTA